MGADICVVSGPAVDGAAAAAATVAVADAATVAAIGAVARAARPLLLGFGVADDALDRNVRERELAACSKTAATSRALGRSAGSLRRQAV